MALNVSAMSCGVSLMLVYGPVMTGEPISGVAQRVDDHAQHVGGGTWSVISDA
ncbi:MAG: hypothetical protein WBA10_21415 [Elainellaceae cyanobacterium]